MQSLSHYDVLVFGVGAMGSATLYALAKRGVKVCGIEQFGIAHSKGSSHGETRLIRKAYFEHPDYVSLLHAAYDGWRELEKESNRQLLTSNGLLLAGKPDSLTIKGLKACYAQHDLPHEILDENTVRNRWPDIQLPDGCTIYYDPVAGFIRAEKSIRTLCKLATGYGAALYTGERLRSWKLTGENIVEVSTSQRTLTADRLVITCGAWAADVLQTLDLNLKVQRKILCWYGTNSSDSAGFQPENFPNFFVETDQGGFYGFPTVGSGVKIGEHYHAGEVTHPDNIQRKVAKNEDKPVSEFVAQTFPKLQPVPIKHTVCMYTMSEDSHFILDHHPHHKNVVIAAGFSGHGFKFAPVIGNILADLATDGTTNMPIDFLRLSRFS